MMKIFKSVLLAFLCMTSIRGFAQTFVTGPLSGTITSGKYYNNTGISIEPNTDIIPGPNQQVDIVTLPPSCFPFLNQLTNNQNFIWTRTPTIQGLKTETMLDQNNVTCDQMQSVHYYDGLGRPSQLIQIKGSFNKNDLIQNFTYDECGREAIKWLPYTLPSNAANDGSYQTNAIIDQSTYYNPNHTGASGTQQGNGLVVIPNPFQQISFENSQLDRVIEQGSPGTDWQTGSQTIRTNYITNDQTPFTNNIISNNSGCRAVALYRAIINLDGTHSLTRDNNYTKLYDVNALSVTITKDENWKNGDGCLNTTEQYKDKDGRIILRRAYDKAKDISNNDIIQMLSTYYVYDNLDNLAFVLTPGADPDNTVAISTDMLNNLCYQYNYDTRGRLMQKRVPGKDWDYMVYNQLDQLVLSQDGNQRVGNKWIVTKYDALGRIIMTGLWSAGGLIDQVTLQSSIYFAAQFDARNYSDNTTGYTFSSYPSSSIDIMEINYYDDYNSIPGIPTAYDQHSSYSSMTKGLATASSTAILLPNGTVSSDRLLAVHYYDDKGRIVKTFSQHYLGGVISPYNYDELSNTYNFDNSVAKTTRQHYTKNSTNTATVLALTIADSYTYDHMGRKTQTDESINGGAFLTLSKTEYNEIGQLYKKHLHSTNGSSYLQDITYAYNERGWLSQINDPVAGPTATTLFNMKLGYNNPASPNSTAQYNGNISEQVYNKGTVGQKFVTYNYDNLNRLVAGNSNEGFSENDINYDLMGNLKTLHRFGDHTGVLTYAYYSGTNQLSGVTSDNNSVTRTYGPYDANGNAPSDGQEHNISYNLLNLPRSIPSLNLSYTYDATGRKLRKVNTTGAGTITEYIDGIQYNGTNIDFVMTEEGRVLNPTTSPNYEYTLTDHLGNNRITFDQTNGKVGEDDYYPFGLDAPRLLNAGNKYLYNKKELQDELGQYDYGARFYDPVIGRWNTIDPHAEKYSSWSPYNYVFNNPIKMVDLNGMDGEVTGSGTKKDPYVIKANYYYVNGSLSNDQVKGLNAAVSDYNKLGGKDGVEIKNADGSKSYVKYNLTATGVKDADAATTAAYGDKFTDKSGNERFFGNVVKTNNDPGGVEFGDGGPRTIRFNDPKIQEGVNQGMNQVNLLEGVAIHEIGHNLGGEHEDGTSTMIKVTTNIYNNQIGGPQPNTFTYPTVSKDFTRIIFGRRDTRMQDPNNARILEAGIYTKQDQ